ncbi:MAG: hypothetical protein JSW50_14945 [Candidatus Latescibacterota bacterium]|nr:MAG: hypothetical protein JSW50_14945 [Candidatus Latescibacterota bacterium]
MKLISILLIAFATVGCGGDLKMDGCWRHVEVAIDGDNSEWSNCSTYLEDEDFAVGVMNDADYLYISLSTADREVQRQVMMSGMIVWVDVTNDKAKSFGVRFPLGMREGDMRERIQEMRDRPDPPDRAEMQQQFVRQIGEMDRFEMIGPHEGNVRLLQIEDSKYVKVKLGVINGAFVYELRVPLDKQKDYLYGLGAKPGDNIAIGWDSPEIDRGEMRGMGGGEMGGGGRGGGGGGYGGGRKGGGMGGAGGLGMRPPGDSFEPPEPFEVWAKVKLVPRSDN